MEIELSDYIPDINGLNLRILKNNHKKLTQLKTSLDVEVDSLIKKYKKQLDDLEKTKNRLIMGGVKPQVTEDFEGSFIKSSEDSVTENENGIQNYWKNVIVNCNRFKGVLNHKDIKILTFLKGIYVIEDNDRCFSINFQFAKNIYFPHEEISKIYIYSGNNINISSTFIQWKSKNLSPIYEPYMIKYNKRSLICNEKKIKAKIEENS